MIKKEIILRSKHDNRPFGVDYRLMNNGQSKPVVLFIHGFKGFKDAMHFNAIADRIAEAGFVYVKMNMSHNGVTPDQPQEFVDLDAFANNNFTIELDDIGVVLDYLHSQEDIPSTEINIEEIYLIGHSRGGSVAVLKACEDSRIKKLVTWAAVPDLEAFWTPDFLEEWKAYGTMYITNARTKQEMPLNYQMVVDYTKNADRFNIGSRLADLKIPFLAIHGTDDETVAFQSLLMFKSFYPDLERKKIEGAGHTFGGSHPWNSSELPDHSKPLVNDTISFLKRN